MFKTANQIAQCRAKSKGWSKKSSWSTRTITDQGEKIETEEGYHYRKVIRLTSDNQRPHAGIIMKSIGRKAMITPDSNPANPTLRLTGKRMTSLLNFSAFNMSELNVAPTDPQTRLRSK